MALSFGQLDIDSPRNIRALCGIVHCQIQTSVLPGEMPMAMISEVRVPVEPMDLEDNEAEATAEDVSVLPSADQLDQSVVVESAPVDVDQLVQQYQGNALMQRLLFIADRCPPLRRDALGALIQYVQKNTFNVSMYQQAHAKLASTTKAQSNAPVPRAPPDLTIGTVTTIADISESDWSIFDQSWVDQTTKRAHSKLEKLDTDLKHYKNNSIKESIRRGQDDLGEHYLDMGNLVDALKCFNRARDYCTSCKHVLQMCFNVIKVAAHVNNWALVSSHVTRAENTADLTAVPTNGIPKEVVLQRLGAVAKLKAVAGLADLAMGKYKSAARNFIQVPFDQLDYPELISPRDVAIYGTFCALATYDRSELQRNVLRNSSFRQFLELEPQLNELLVKFHESAYDASLTIMNSMHDSLQLDQNLAPHVHSLYSSVRNRGLVQYFSPYLSADMRLMARAFGSSAESLQDELAALILKGDIRARIDSQHETLHAENSDPRASVYEKALNTGRVLERRAQTVLLRAAMHRAKICVRPQIRDTQAGSLAMQFSINNNNNNNNNNADVDIFGDTPENSAQGSPQ